MQNLEAFQNSVEFCNVQNPMKVYVLSLGYTGNTVIYTKYMMYQYSVIEVVNTGRESNNVNEILWKSGGVVVERE